MCDDRETEYCVACRAEVCKDTHQHVKYFEEYRLALDALALSEGRRS